MIRNDRGDHFLLITQHDHAVLAGQLAERLGNLRFDGPDPREPTLLGVELHDCGWPLHDDAPTLNAAGLPLHVLEIDAPLAASVWRQSARRAAEVNPYTGLLVSLHVFTLSSIAVKTGLTPGEAFDQRHNTFLINQFQQDEIERQELLREKVGLRTDRALHLGLLDPGEDREEDRLRFNYSWLRAMDGISLGVCTGKKLFDRLPEIYPKIGPIGFQMTIDHPAPDVVQVDPWPFSTSRVQLSLPARRLPKEKFADVEAFRAAYRKAELVEHRISVVPR